MISHNSSVQPLRWPKKLIYSRKKDTFVTESCANNLCCFKCCNTILMCSRLSMWVSIGQGVRDTQQCSSYSQLGSQIIRSLLDLCLRMQNTVLSRKREMENNENHVSMCNCLQTTTTGVAHRKSTTLHWTYVLQLTPFKKVELSSKLFTVLTVF